VSRLNAPVLANKLTKLDITTLYSFGTEYALYIGRERETMFFDSLIMIPVQRDNMKTQIKENNAGGLSLDLLTRHNRVIAVITGIEHNTTTHGLKDLVDSARQELNYHDADGWYDENGNNQGDKDHAGCELTANDIIDKSDSTKIIATYDDNKGIAEIYIDNMGHAGKKYFGLV